MLWVWCAHLYRAGAVRVWGVPRSAATVAEFRTLKAVDEPLLLGMVCAGAWLGFILQPGRAESCPGVLRDEAGAAPGPCCKQQEHGSSMARPWARAEREQCH